MSDRLVVLLASNNSGKGEEFRRLFAGSGLELRLPRDLELPTLDVPETGRTYRANARLKARTYAYQYTMPALADDSGLSVRALGGRPGVHTARYGATPGPDGLLSNAPTPQYQRLLAEVAATGSPDRTAHFYCVLCLCLPAGWPSSIASTERLIETTGTCRGVLSPAPRGDGGFGYDPILLLPQFGRTVAELTSVEKDAVSHRGIAARRLLSRLSLTPDIAARR